MTQVNTSRLAGLGRELVLAVLTASILAPVIIGAASIISDEPGLHTGEAVDAVQCYRLAGGVLEQHATTLELQEQRRADRNPISK